jgi:hypothetical protein
MPASRWEGEAPLMFGAEDNFFGTTAETWAKIWRRAPQSSVTALFQRSLEGEGKTWRKYLCGGRLPAHTCVVRCRSVPEINSGKSRGVYHNRRSYIAPYCELIPRPSESAYRYSSYWIGTRGKLFASLQYPSESRWYDVFGTYGISRSLFWYSLMTLLIWCTIFMIIYHFVLQLLLSKCTVMNWRLKDVFECSLMGKKAGKPRLQCRKKLRRKEMQNIVSPVWKV